MKSKGVGSFAASHSPQLEHSLTNARQALAFADFHLDLHNECLWADRRLIRLQRKTFSVLRYLVERPNRLVKKEDLLRDLWDNLHVSDSVIKTHLNHIRVVIRDDARKPRFIETVHGRGYRFIERVRVVCIDDTGQLLSLASSPTASSVAQ
jgi:DNA-binding winged helix-turn-helix (wHTH) protein